MGAMLSFPMFMFGMAGIPFRLHGGMANELRVMIILGVLLQSVVAVGLGRWAAEEGPAGGAIRRSAFAYISFWAAVLGVSTLIIIWGAAPGERLSVIWANLAQSAILGMVPLTAAIVAGQAVPGVRSR